MGGAILAALGLLAGHECELVEASRVTLQETTIRVRDVVEQACADLLNTPGIGDLVIAKLPENAGEFAVARAGVATLVTRRAPGLRLKASGDDNIVFERRRPTDQPSSDINCFELSTSARSGAPITADSLRETPCRDGSHPRALYYDRPYGAVRAAADLVEGQYVGRLSVPHQAYPDTGVELSLAIAVGPVRIERQVWALQPAPHGDSLFVRTEDGEIIRASIATHRQEEGDHE